MTHFAPLTHFAPPHIKNPRRLKKYLANWTKFIKNPRGLLCQCALPWAHPWGLGLNEIKNARGMSLLHTLPYAWGVRLKNGSTLAQKASKPVKLPAVSHTNTYLRLGVSVQWQTQVLVQNKLDQKYSFFS